MVSLGLPLIVKGFNTIIEIAVGTMARSAADLSTGRLEKMIAMIMGFVRHLIVGGVGTLFYMAVLTGLVEVLKQEPVSSSVMAFVCLIIYTYLFNRFWVYRATRGHGYSVPRFLIVEMVALLLNTAIMYFTVEILGWWYIGGLLSATLLLPPTNFLLNFYWAFK